MFALLIILAGHNGTPSITDRRFPSGLCDTVLHFSPPRSFSQTHTHTLWLLEVVSHAEASPLDTI